MHCRISIIFVLTALHKAIWGCSLQSVSDEEIVRIVDKHNELRRDPQTTETPYYMMKMVRKITELLLLVAKIIN